MLTSKSTAVYSLQQSCKERISLQTPQEEEGQTQRLGTATSAPLRVGTPPFAGSEP